MILENKVFFDFQKVKYADLGLHQRINTKSWVKELCLLAHGSVLKTLLMVDNLPMYIRQNTNETCNKETMMYKKNWRI